MSHRGSKQVASNGLYGQKAFQLVIGEVRASREKCAFNVPQEKQGGLEGDQGRTKGAIGQGRASNGPMKTDEDR